MNRFEASVMISTPTLPIHLNRVPRKLKAKVEMRPLRAERRNLSLKGLQSTLLQAKSEGIPKYCLSISAAMEQKGCPWLLREHSDPAIVVKPSRVRLPPLRRKRRPKERLKNSPLEPWSNGTSSR